MAPDTQDIYERLEELDPTSFETDAIKLLTGLGFEQKMLQRCTKVGAVPRTCFACTTLTRCRTSPCSGLKCSRVLSTAKFR